MGQGESQQAQAKAAPAPAQAQATPAVATVYATSVPGGLPNRAGQGAPVAVAKAVAIPAQAATAAVPQEPEEKLDEVPQPPNLNDELCKLKEKELEYMQANSLAVSDWIMTLDDSQVVLKRNAEVHQDVKQLAISLLQKKEKFEESHALLTAVDKRREDRRKSVEALMRERDAIMSNHSPEQLAATLAERAAAIDMEAEDDLSQAIDGRTMDSEALSVFRQAFLEKKALKHKRLAMKERIASQA